MRINTGRPLSTTENIPRYSHELSQINKNRLRRFQSQKQRKFKNSQPQTKFTGSYLKKSVIKKTWLHRQLRPKGKLKSAV